MDSFSWRQFRMRVIDRRDHAKQFFNDTVYLSFFVAMRGFRESGFDFYWSLYLSAQKRRPCVYISTPLRCQPKVVRLVLDPWFKSSYEPLRKLSFIHVRTTKAQISLHICADWSAPLFFAVARSVFFFFEGEASHKLKWKAKWFSGMYKFLIESVITGLFSPLICLLQPKYILC